MKFAMRFAAALALLVAFSVNAALVEGVSCSPNRVDPSKPLCERRLIEVPGVITEAQAIAMDKRMGEIEDAIRAGASGTQLDALVTEHKGLAAVRTPDSADGAKRLADQTRIEALKKKPTLTPTEMAEYLGLLGKYVNVPGVPPKKPAPAQANQPPR